MVSLQKSLLQSNYVISLRARWAVFLLVTASLKATIVGQITGRQRVLLDGLLQGAYKFGKIKFPEFSRFSRPSKQSCPDNYKVKTRCNKSP